MRDQVIILVAAAGLVLTAICYASPHARVTLNTAQTEILAIDFFGVSGNMQAAARQQLAQHSR